MAEIIPYFDTSKPVGQRLGPQMREEIAAIAPTNIPPGSIGSDELNVAAVEAENIAFGAVEADAIKAGAVGTDQLANGGVTGSKVEDHALGPAKMAAGIVTIKDANGNDIEMPAMIITSAAYAALLTPNPNTLYLIF